MVFTGTFGSDDPDKKYPMTFWEYMDLFFWNTTTAWRINIQLLQGLPVTLVNIYFFLCFFLVNAGPQLSSLVLCIWSICAF